MKGHGRGMAYVVAICAADEGTPGLVHAQKVMRFIIFFLYFRFFDLSACK